MANDNNDIGSIVKKCKILLLDIEGTTTSISFVKDKLFPYAEENVKEFLDSQWESDDVKQVVAALRKLAIDDKEKDVEGVVAIPGEDASKEDQIEGLVKNVKWQMDADRKAGPLKQLQGLIWKQGYDKGEIKGHVYDDVQAALEQWRSVEGQKVYIYSSGSVQAQKLLFGQSVSGDLLPLIDGHFDTTVGSKQEPASYATIAEKIGCAPEEILFLTDIVKEGEAGRSSGLQVALVSRATGAPPETSFPVLTSLAQLARASKRKPDAQVEEEQPAKLLKTDIKEAVVADVKATKSVEKAPKEPEKMEIVEPTAVPSEEPKQETKAEDSTPTTETIVEEVSDTNEIPDIPVIDVKPTVIEEEKTENNETEKMDTDTTAIVEEPAPEVKGSDMKTGGETAPGDKETPVTVITEIEEITNDKQALSDEAEIIEDIEPVVEEPPAVEEMEELQNVGEVLEKECDEILSKVQDVTNLDNIPLKPLLNTIAEESMDIDSGDTNDMMERILDSELELEMKQCPDIDLSTVTEMSDSKPETVAEETNVEKEKMSPESSDAAEDKSTDIVVKEDKVFTDDKVDESSPPTKVTAVEENKVETETSEKIETEIATQISTDSSVSTEIKESASIPEDSKDGENVPDKPKTESENCTAEPEVKEAQVNGKTTNGDVETVNLNGNASKEEELSSRLSVENGKEVVNGANGDSGSSEKGQGDSKMETEIKVKTVATDEPRNDPIEQPTEA